MALLGLAFTLQAGRQAEGGGGLGVGVGGWGLGLGSWGLGFQGDEGGGWGLWDWGLRLEGWGWGMGLRVGGELGGLGMYLDKSCVQIHGAICVPVLVQHKDVEPIRGGALLMSGRTHPLHGVGALEHATSSRHVTTPRQHRPTS